jgi:uncharacterized protein with PIN domain
VKKLNMRIGSISKILFPDYSFCKKCNSTWNVVREKTVMYDKNNGCFAICEKCWDDLDYYSRYGYYHRAFASKLTKEQIETMRENIEKVS